MCSRVTISWLPVLLLALAACGPDEVPNNADASSPTPDASSVDAAIPSPECEAAAQALTAEIYQAPRACSAVVRMDYQSYAILGYQLVCGGYAGLDEATARARSQLDTGFGAGALALNPSMPEDAYVFWREPADFGGVGVVSALTGLTVFGGGIVWAGTGEITYPLDWRPADQLAGGCPPSGGVNQIRGYSLESGLSLTQIEIDAAMAVVLQTALPDAFWRGGYAFHAVVLAYPRTLGPLDPAKAEWIVVFQGGWLE